MSCPSMMSYSMRSKYYRFYAIMSWTHVSGTVEQRNTPEVFAFTSVFVIVLWDIQTFEFRSVFWKIFLSVFWIIKVVLHHKDYFWEYFYCHHKKCHVAGTSLLPNGFSTSPTWSELLTARTTASGRREALRARDSNRLVMMTMMLMRMIKWQKGGIASKGLEQVKVDIDDDGDDNDKDDDGAE